MLHTTVYTSVLCRTAELLSHIPEPGSNRGLSPASRDFEALSFDLIRPRLEISPLLNGGHTGSGRYSANGLGFFMQKFIGGAAWALYLVKLHVYLQ